MAKRHVMGNANAFWKGSDTSQPLGSSLKVFSHKRREKGDALCTMNFFSEKPCQLDINCN